VAGVGRTPLVAVTDHAVERYRQRVRGSLWEEGEDAAVPRRFTDALRQRGRRRR
jgi:hypothetical protein